MTSIGLTLLEPTDLYNILNQSSLYPRISDNNYLLLLDARNKNEFNESHVITAKRAQTNELGDYSVPYDAELECKQHVIVYDGNTKTLGDDGAAVECGKVLWANGSRNPVKILKGGYEDFSALYPFLRTQKVIYMPRDTDEVKPYPIEIIPGLVYVGTKAMADSPYIQKDVKIKAQVNCSNQPGELFKDEGPTLFSIPVDDDENNDLSSKFKDCCEFIDDHVKNNRVVLVASELNVSRSSCVALAYLMHYHKWSLKDAYNHLVKCHQRARPNRGFVEQLSVWEKELFGELLTDISDPNY